jgi:multiple sugar transport system permease protein
MLYRKHVEGLFSERLESLKIAYDGDGIAFERVDPPARPNPALADAWWRFIAQADLPVYAYTCGNIETGVSKTMPKGLREFKAQIKQRYHGDLNRANRALGTQFVQWHGFYLIPESFLLRREKPVETPLVREFNRFKARQPRWNLYYFTVEGFFKTLFLKTKYTRDIAEYNREHGTPYVSYDAVHLSRRLPDTTPREREDWVEFVRQTLNLAWIRADEAAAAPYREFLKAKYLDIATLNRNYATAWTAFDEVPLVREPPAEGIVLSDWDAFLQGWVDPDTGRMHLLPAEMLQIHSVDFMFRDYLQRTCGTIESVNRALNTGFRDFMDVRPPQRDAHYLDFLAAKGAIRREFATRNFKTVLDYMVFHGRGVFNTVVYCALAVLGALLVNPLAAYAMSRFRMPTTYKLLLFLMLTMAFPPMVAQIPQFLMLREMNLLNTFWALILPGLANGYSIFLLKGFFDSLPRELYESAALDGAGEVRIFWQITMTLSTPILAVIALNAFTHAYSNFMLALLICQDEKMWTLMVWLYELQQKSGPGVVYASLLIAAIPTLLVFVFCQKIIMRGIVVPVEK